VSEHRNSDNACMYIVVDFIENTHNEHACIEKEYSARRNTNARKDAKTENQTDIV